MDTVQTAPAEAGAQTEEKVMRSKKSTKAKTAAKARTKVKAGATTKKATGGVRPGSKLETIVGLLKRPQGCTAAEIMAACKWPSVSVPQQARAAGLTLKTEKEGRVTRYRAA
jgi:hypothetical protein